MTVSFVAVLNGQERIGGDCSACLLLSLLMYAYKSTCVQQLRQQAGRGAPPVETAFQQATAQLRLQMHQKILANAITKLC